MKVGKIINGNIELIEVENGVEVNGTRTEQEFYDNGYKKACVYDGDCETTWTEYSTCFVEEPIIEIEENE